jgi:hypothetical protein
LLNHSGNERAGKPRPWLPGCGIDRRSGDVSARESAQLDVKLRPYASRLMDPHSQEGMAPSTMRDDEVDIISLVSERLEARELE